MTDDKKLGSNALEPCVAMPEIKPAPNPLDWGQPADGVGVLSEQGMWAARAASAREAAELLETAHRAVEPVLRSNYFGQDCAEGESLRDSLLAIVGANGSWRSELVDQINRLNDLADQCDRAAKELAATDREAGEGFRSDR
ncbi:hypothetical protein GIY30_23840 [Gordonia sp. HNM0687]|uniref:ESX-1 secretion-associated protein n=1 Tax=Gordonia mangrovi TaxID=2665643 RepID=A0A6L7GZD1_9ACTN|nr:hypothetical protein [Gordonia mangrovi]MXP24358.1 hypothetical protein [Gordonia mangrovi]UVF80035.1 hypothetical protein NWF22_09515 [Gordonia mangrovi]